jgi:hypothetical protein
MFVWQAYLIFCSTAEAIPLYCVVQGFGRNAAVSTAHLPYNCVLQKGVEDISIVTYCPASDTCLVS